MKDASNKAFWQRFAWLYGPIMEASSRPLYEAVCAEIRPQLRRDMRLLELACGTGQLSYPLAPYVARWEATDFSEAMIAAARRNMPQDPLRFSVQDATALPYPPDSFDAVLIANALHIMPHPERAMAEIRRVLKPGGLLFAPTFVHGEHPGPRLRIKLMELAGFRTYHKWTGPQLTSFVSREGFRVTGHKPLGSGLAPLCCLEAVKR